MNSDRRVVASAPGRAGIIGNPTDMYGGSVLSCSVGMRARAEISLLPAGEPQQAPLYLLQTANEECRIASREELRPNHDRFDVVKAVLDYLRLPPLTCRIWYESEIPLRSGMAGSTALVAALLQALLAWQGEFPHRYSLAERARYIELHYLKVVCGYQDAYMVTFGGLNFLEFRGKQFYRQEEAELFATVEPLAPYVAELPFVLGFTGVQHASSAVHRPLRERWLDGETEVVQGYRRITEIARTGKKALLMRDWPLLGRMMNENHAIQRDLGGSGESNETLIAAALAAGAPGAKLAGAGDGGTIIALWPWSDRSPLEQALRQAGASEIYLPEVAPGVTLDPVGTGEAAQEAATDAGV